MAKSLAIIGGGLWGSLLAYRLQQLRPELDFVLYEKENFLGGQHTWCFHGSDITSDSFQWLKPFITKSWCGQAVIFPQRRRQLGTSYHAIRSEQLNKVMLKSLPPGKLRLGTSVNEGEIQKCCELVIDARGGGHSSSRGYQKFLGLDLKLIHPHGLKLPLIMDATVPQLEGYRFLYMLPWDQHTLMVEDTRYSLEAGIREEAMQSELLEEVQKRGWKVEKVLRREVGHLPIPLGPVQVHKGKAIVLSGIFHDTTGYSLPQAVKLIERLVRLENFDYQELNDCVENYRQELEAKRSFFRLINLLLFKAAGPQDRYRMLQHFYGLPEPLIERFYAADLNWSDKIRFFMGRPPVSVLSAAKLLLPGERL